jgi:hypothetical protein
VKKLIKRLEAARGNGTSMISLIIRTLPQLRGALPPSPGLKSRMSLITLFSAEGPDLSCGEDVG